MVTVTAQVDDRDDDRSEPRGQVPSTGRCRRPRPARFGLLVRHHVHVDLAGVLHRRRADTFVEDARPARPSRRAQDQLGGVHLAGEIQKRRRYVVADDGVQGGAQAGDDVAYAPHLRGRHSRQSVAAHHVHHHQFGAGLRRDAKRSAHQRLRLGVSGDGDHDPFAGLPGIADVVVGPVLGQRGVDLVGQPQQREFAQRGQVARTEVVGQRSVDAFGCVDIAVGQPAPQRLRCDVHQFDLVCRPDHFIGHLLLLLDAGDSGDDVIEALQVLDVDRRDHRDTRVEQLLDVLPPFRVRAAGGIGVGQFVDQDHLGAAGQHGGHVEFRELPAAVGDVPRRNDLDLVEQLGSLLAAVGLHHRGHQIGTALESAVRLAEHGERLADSRCRTQVDAQLTPFALGARRAGGAHLPIIHPTPAHRGRC